MQLEPLLQRSMLLVFTLKAWGKSPQHPYSHHGNHALQVGELLHMDICSPYPVQTPDGKQYFYIILDNKSNFGFTHLLWLKSNAFLCYCATEAFLLRSFGKLIVAICVDGMLELTRGQMGKHFTKQGIVVQCTVPYAHQQAGKIEHYICMIEEGGQILLANLGSSMLFWGWAILMSQYLWNQLPTSTLAPNITLFEALTMKKPDLSHLWVCSCYSIWITYQSWSLMFWGYLCGLWRSLNRMDSLWS